MKTKAIGLILILAISSGVQALGFRGILVASFLNEPLDARIELVSINPADVDELRVSLASPEVFIKAGLTRPPHLTKLQFKTLVGDNQQVYIHVTTKDGVREPYLDFLLEVAWRENTLFREYTILLDPPASKIMAAKTTAVPAVTVQEPPKRVATAQALPSASAPQQQYGSVKRGETLWAIAARVRPDSSISVEQMMMALLEANPHAFQHGNVNFLKLGAVLDVPGYEAINQLSVYDARRAFLQQTSDWRVLRRGLPATAKVETASQLAAARESKAKIQAEQRLEGDAAGDSAKLRVVETGGEESKKLLGTEEKLASEETVASSEDRLSEEIADSKRDLEAVLEINRDLENLQGALELKVEALRKSLEERNRAIDNLEQRISNLKAESVASEGDSSVSEQRKIAGSVGSSIEMGRKQMEKQPLTEPNAATHIRDDWLAMVEKYWMQLVVAALLLFVLLLLFFLLRKRRMESGFRDSEAFGSYVDVDGQPATQERVLVPQYTARQLNVTGSSSSEGDFSSDATADAESALTEVDIYLAYRRYGPAEMLLKQAIENNPENMVLKAKLLEIYAFRKDKKKFVAAIEQVYQPMIARSPELWAKVVEIGRDIAPDHELIAGAVLSGEDADAIIDNLAFGLDDLTESNGGEHGAPKAKRDHT